MSNNDTPYNPHETPVHRMQRRLAQIAKGDKRYKDRLLSETEKAALIDMVENGSTIGNAVNQGVVSTYGAVIHTRRADPKFDEAMQRAVIVGIEAMLDTANDQAQDAALSGDNDRARIAESLMRVASNYAEKRAPREYGALLKVAGHDGGALSVVVQDYSKAIDGGQLQTIDVAADSADVDEKPETRARVLYNESASEPHCVANDARDSQGAE